MVSSGLSRILRTSVKRTESGGTAVTLVIDCSPYWYQYISQRCMLAHVRHLLMSLVAGGGGA